MNLKRWREFPKCQPNESGFYMVNCKLYNMYMTVSLFFDSTTSTWYQSKDRSKVIDGISAFNPDRILVA